MDLEERQRQRQAKMLAEIDAVLAEADQALAKANNFFNGEGAAIKARFEALPAAERERIDKQAREIMADIDRKVAEDMRRKVFEQQKDAYRPANWRKLV